MLNQGRKSKVSPPKSQDLPLDVVGSTTFGRYPKISVSQTFNMIISDEWLVPYAGYKNVLSLYPGGVGRSIYKSVKLNKMVVVINEKVFLVSPNLNYTLIGTLQSFQGDVFIDENDTSQIAICDKFDIWVYNYGASPPSFTKAQEAVDTPLDFTPGYVCFQDGYMISVDLNSAQWRLSALGDASIFPNDSQHVGGFQTKPDLPIAVSRLPGRENFLFVFGSTVAEPWYDVGATLFPYQRSSGINIDYGAINSDTIASSDNIICWLAQNEKSGPFIMYSSGSDPQKISTDGIDFKLASLTNPSDSHAFMFKQDGHLFYQIVFPTDNVSYTYDFNTQKFFTVTDPYMNYHIAKKVAYFNDTYYFVSLNDGNIYQMSSQITNYNGQDIPRVRVCSTIRLPDTTAFVCNNISFPIEMGQDGVGYLFENLSTENFVWLTTEAGQPICEEDLGQYFPAVDLSISVDGGYNFGSYDRMKMNDIGHRMNRFVYYNLGWSNELVVQLRFFSTGRFVVGQGTTSVYQ